MPLSKSTSHEAFKKNIAELIRTKASAPRAKGIKTLAKKEGVSKETAKRKMAAAIAYNIKRS